MNAWLQQWQVELQIANFGHQLLQNIAGNRYKDFINAF